MARLRPRRLGLRTRLSLTFALGALVLSVILSIVTYGLARENLVTQRQETAVGRVLTNAVTVRNGLQTGNEEKLLTSIPTPEGAQPVLFHEQKWYAKNPAEYAQDALPASLRADVERGQAASMLYTYDGVPYLVVGVPVPAQNAAYYEGVSLIEIQKVLDGLAISLLGAAVITTLLGGLTGFFVARRTLTPLVDVGKAAEDIAGGKLDTRLEGGDDPDLERLTVSFNHMVVALQDRIERDARFASEVSHELRSPLMTLSASLEVLENARDEISPRAQTALDLLTADVDRFQQLVEDLLEISRYDVGAVTLHAEEVLLPELVIAAVNASGTGPVPVTYDEDVTDVVVEVDKRRFGQVLTNLLDNARKYGGGATRVELTLVPEAAAEATGDVGTTGEPAPEPARWNRRARIAVEDGGPGVVAGERQVIFDRFSRGAESGRRALDSGVGLGLALVDEHVRLHGGEVWVEDRPDGESGARFVVELPAEVL